MRKLTKVHIFNLVWPTLNEGKDKSKSHKNRCPCLFVKWVSKSTLKFEYRESRQNCLFSTLVWPALNKGQNSFKSHKNRCPCLSLKWVSKSTLKFQFREIRQKCIFSTLFDQPWARSKIAPNLIRIDILAYLSNGYLNLL